MARQTLVYTAMRDPEEPDDEIQETWTVLTHPMGDEFWSEILDGHRHPYVQEDEHGYDTVQKYFGETVQESRQSALAALREVVEERAGRVLEIGADEEV